jgi:dGTPase
MSYDESAYERRVPEPPKSAGLPRSPFERDRARVLHSSALRRLAAKTQVVGVGVDDFPRTRLTHSLECAQIGRELGAALGCDPDVVEAACLAHDVGHPPFGHNGEVVLAEAAAACGGFEGNAQSLRVLVRLEAKVPGVGLNLTRAVLDAATKYPWPRSADDPVKFGAYDDDLPALEWVRRGAPPRRQCLEAQVMDWADDVAYSVHDLEDGVHAGHIDLDGLDRDAVAAHAAAAYSTHAAAELRPVLDDLAAAPWWVRGYDGGRSTQVALKRMTSELIARFCTAAYDAMRSAYGAGPLSRYAADLAVPDWARAECALLKGVAGYYVMARADAMERQAAERVLLGELVDALVDRSQRLEPLFAEAYAAADDAAGRLRAVVDQVASLTDTSARGWHASLCTRG